MLIEKYERLLELAEEYPQYMLMIPRIVVAFHPNQSRRLGIPELDRLYELRQQLMENASVQYRGYSKLDIGMQGPVDNHCRFGVVGPQQIAVMFSGKIWKPKGTDPGRWCPPSFVEESPQDPIKNLKDGDRVLVMVKRKDKDPANKDPRVSVLPMEG